MEIISRSSVVCMNFTITGKEVRKNRWEFSATDRQLLKAFLRRIVCAAVCVLQNYLIWLILLKQQTTICSGSSSETIIFSLVFYLRGLTITITCGLTDHLTFYTALRLDLFAWCVRLSRLLVGFRTHFKSLHFHFISFHSRELLPKNTHLFDCNFIIRLHDKDCY